MRDIDIKAWRDMIGYVPQETFLFHDTIRANVTLGDARISPARVESALARAEAWTSSPHFRRAWTRLSVSEARGFPAAKEQRIAIARALIRDPALLILDEATTALDPVMEAGIVATVRRLAGKVTVLSISHQPAMRLAADIVYSLDNGGVSSEKQDGRLDGTTGTRFPHDHGRLCDLPVWVVNILRYPAPVHVMQLKGMARRAVECRRTCAEATRTSNITDESPEPAHCESWSPEARAASDRTWSSAMWLPGTKCSRSTISRPDGAKSFRRSRAWRLRRAPLRTRPSCRTVSPPSGRPM